MKTLSNILILAAIVTSCTSENKLAQKAAKTDTTLNQQPMKNFISIVEIPVTDLARATAFYQSIMNIKLEQMEIDGVQMGVFPNEEGTVNVVLSKGSDYKSSADGALVYLNAGDDLQPALDRVSKNGGDVVVPKTHITPEMGYFALFIDTEGNKVGLHSTK